MRDKRRRGSAAKIPKLRFLVDHDAAATAGTVAALGWRTYAANPFATDAENIARAVQQGYSYLTMDTGTVQFRLKTLPFTVVLGGNAQQSASTASAEIYELSRLVREGDIQPGLHQRVKITAEGTKVEMQTAAGERTVSIFRNPKLRKPRI